MQHFKNNRIFSNPHLETTAPVIYYYTALAKSQTNPVVAFNLSDFSYFLMRASEGTVQLTNIIAHGAGKGLMNYGEQWIDLISHPRKLPMHLVDRFLSPVRLAGIALTKAIDAINLACSNPEEFHARVEQMISNSALFIQDNPEEAIAMVTEMLLHGTVRNALRFKNIQPLVNAIKNQQELVNSLLTRLTGGLKHRIAQLLEPVKTAINNGARRANGIIKSYNDDAIKLKHVFSNDHRAQGIMKLGNTQAEIISRLKKIVDKVDACGMLKNGQNCIKTIINGLEVDININIADGIVRSLNGYVGNSNRICKNTINWLEQ
ncbi:hypothetical protein IPF37_05970 [bacterium]|nr:MAG: hypothetical protein IPF37_05970 [bacterium]